MTKEYTEAFQYAKSASGLWKELEERFEGSNGPRLYQLKREINNLTQDNQSAMAYYTQLKKLWDESELLRNFPSCKCWAIEAYICNMAKRMQEINDEYKLIQFLRGLNDAYEVVKSQILLIDPFPTINQAYAMVL